MNLILIISFIYIGKIVAQNSICTPKTCRYGECEQLKSGYRCHCVDGVKGDNCDRLLLPNDDRCLMNPCWNNGICRSTNFGTGWLCVCLSGTAGNTCRTLTDVSCKDKCKNGGECRIINFVAKCFCTNDYTGSSCETKIPLCERQNPCLYGGICVNNSCKCPVGFKGEKCELIVPKSLSVLNKGGFTALISFSYLLNNKRVEEKASLTSGLTKVFTYDKNATQEVVRVSALAGKKDFVYERVLNFKECWHVWGTTLFPAYSKINC